LHETRDTISCSSYTCCCWQQHSLIVLLLLLLIVVLLRARIENWLMLMGPMSLMMVPMRQPLLLLLVAPGSCSRAEERHLVAIVRHVETAICCTICCCTTQS
jgi:hypothetical protein